MKALIALFSCLLFLYVTAAFLSSTETKYSCVGTSVLDGGIAKSNKVFIRLNEYRFWVWLWSKSDGDLWVEVPGREVLYYAFLSKAGDIYGVFLSTDKDGLGTNLSGSFSTLSKSLKLYLNEKDLFEGSCSSI